MTPYDDIGRIKRRPLEISVLTLLILGCVTTIARVGIRLRLQGHISIDDGFLIFAVVCAITSVAVLFSNLDRIYTIQAAYLGVPYFVIPADLLDLTYNYSKRTTVLLVMSWTGICAIKFSFLLLFRKLINTMPRTIMYWRYVVALNVVVFVYGILAYILPCPWYDSIKILSCSRGKMLSRTVGFACSQMALDILTDFLILAIPLRLIWKIKVRLGQKIALFCSLCLSFILIGVTIVRSSGIMHKGLVDAVWETYWNVISTEVGIILAVVAAFRALFVKQHDRAPGTPSKLRSFYSRSKRLLLSTRKRWFSSRDGYASGESSDGADNQIDVSIPAGNMTGMRTFIDKAGQTRVHGLTTVQTRVWSPMADGEDLEALHPHRGYRT